MKCKKEDLISMVGARFRVETVDSKPIKNTKG